MNEKIYSNEMLSSFRKHFDKESSKHITYPKFIFLCGRGFVSQEEYVETNRGIIGQFINKIYSDAFIVLSEQLWEDDFCSNIDLLTFEEFLAEVSDAVILFVESPGTFCELGAFAYADVLFSDKLIIVMDEKYRKIKSFVADGPVSKAVRDNSKVVYARLDDGSLLASDELRGVTHDLIRKLSLKSSSINKRTSNKTANGIQINSFIIEILEIIRMTQPITFNSLIKLYKEIKGFDSFKVTSKNSPQSMRKYQKTWYN